MLCVYTFVFSVIFRVRWGIQSHESSLDFALALFTGMITFGIFSEVINGAPLLIIQNVNYVKKVVFPLEILVVVRLFSVLINALFSLVVLICGILIINQFIHWTAILLPLVWLPMILMTLGFSYFFASLGVFIRDLGAAVGILTTMLFFLTPIFYPLHAVPEKFRFFSSINPLAIFVENSRAVVLWGTLPDWPVFILVSTASILVFTFGFIWFVKSKKTFADVI
jgi:lipopolysaccharide transport system permease protein